MINAVALGLRDPIEKTIKGKKFWLSKFPYSVARKLLYNYPMALVPQFKDYATNEQMMVLLLSFVAVETAPNVFMKLDSIDMIDNHITSPEMGLELEKEMGSHNYDFFRDGRVWTFFEIFARNMMSPNTKTSTNSPEQSSPNEAQP